MIYTGKTGAKTIQATEMQDNLPHRLDERKVRILNNAKMIKFVKGPNAGAMELNPNHFVPLQ